MGETEKNIAEAMHGDGAAIPLTFCPPQAEAYGGWGNIFCRLPYCDKTFLPGKITQEFCCEEHRERFWALARKTGKEMLDVFRREREEFLKETEK